MCAKWVKGAPVFTQGGSLCRSRDDHFFKPGMVFVTTGSTAEAHAEIYKRFYLVLKKYIKVLSFSNQILG